MPPQPIFALESIDTSKVAVTREQIYQVNPHRFEFMQLDGIYHIDHEKGEIAGYREVRADEFWVRGHIPGRPILPGVLMIETAAQIVSYYAMTETAEKGFLGFASVDAVKFRGAVVPGDRIIFLAKLLDKRSRRWTCATQGFVNGRMVFEGTITGMKM